MSDTESLCDDAQPFNDGHIVEGLDRCHTLMTMLDQLLDQHPAIIKAGAQDEVSEALQLIMDAYQKIGELDDALDVPGGLYTCIGKGGAYEHIGVTIGAGTSRGQEVVVYCDTDTGQLFHRTPEDFEARMQRLDKSTEAALAAELAPPIARAERIGEEFERLLAKGAVTAGGFQDFWAGWKAFAALLDAEQRRIAGYPENFTTDWGQLLESKPSAMQDWLGQHPEVERELILFKQAMLDWNRAQPHPLIALGHEYAVGEAAARLARRLLPGETGEVTVTCDETGQCVAVTRCDDEGRVLKVLWEATEVVAV